MTSRVSFLKLMIDALRRHLASVLITVLAFFIHVIAFFLNVQNTLSREYMPDYTSSSSFIGTPKPVNAEYILEDLAVLSLPSLWNAILAMTIGVFLAYDLFRYLHSKKETDFYESLPIRKQTRFRMLLMASTSLFVILATFSTLLEFAIIFGTGYGSALLFKNMMWSLLCMIGCFLACYVTTALAMIMTGHTIVALLGFGLFASYIPLIISNLFPLYANNFFETYVYHDISENYYYFSPITLAYKASYSWNYNGNMWKIQNHWTYVLGCFVFATVIGILAYLLFLRRPSETAGRAMAFEKFNPVIRLLIVIPLALYAGLLLNEIAAYAKNAWLIFGIIFAAFLLHGIIECIFQFDIKALISKKRQLLCAILFCLGFLFVFWIDLFQYDKYMPTADELKAVAINTYLFDEGKYNWEEHKDHLTGESIELALDAIKDIRMSEKASDDEDYTYTNDFTVTYTLKNGIKKERQYFFYGNEFPDSLDKLTATEDFKNDFCILYHTDVIDITSISVSNGVDGLELKLTDSEKDELYHLYLKEYSKLTLTDSLSKSAIFNLTFEYPSKNRDYITGETYKVYSDFEETIDFLRKHGAKSFTEFDNIKLENLEIHSSKYNDIEKQFVSNEEQLNALKSYMVLGDFMNYHMDYDRDYLNGTVRYVINGVTRYMDVYIKHSDFKQILNK